MPPVYIEHRLMALGKGPADVLKQVVRREAADLFSTPELSLSQGDFSLILVPLSEGSEPTHDITIRVQLHAFPERLEKNDPNAETMATAISQAMTGMLPKGTTIGVSLLCAEIGWGTSTII